jgi:hypothetical protein
MTTRLCPLVALLATLIGLPATVSAASGPRAAVLVGANRAGGDRAALQHAYRDAHRMADVLISVGGFDRTGVTVLEDPDPDALIAALRRQGALLAGRPDSLLFFYYSGHADGNVLYPAGRALPLEQVRTVFDGMAASVRLGMIDACGAGSWTRAKGFTTRPPFAITLPLDLASEGSVLIASSSGTEAAHESDRLQGSFFSTYFGSALRGAADRNQDGEVTLTEAFEYAKERTIRDTARQGAELQHPSYALNLRGRKDLVLARIALSPSAVDMVQREGPLEVIHLDSGRAVLELPAGQRRVKIAVPPGRYLVRKHDSGGGYRTKELLVANGTASRIDEEELTIVGVDSLAAKGPERAHRRVIGLDVEQVPDGILFGLDLQLAISRYFALSLRPFYREINQRAIDLPARTPSSPPEGGGVGQTAYTVGAVLGAQLFFFGNAPQGLWAGVRVGAERVTFMTEWVEQTGKPFPDDLVVHNETVHPFGAVLGGEAGYTFVIRRWISATFALGAEHETARFATRAAWIQWPTFNVFLRGSLGFAF